MSCSRDYRSTRSVALALSSVVLLGTACGREQPTAPVAEHVLGDRVASRGSSSQDSLSILALEIRALASGRGIVPLNRPPRVRSSLVYLGRVLAFDKILSGNRNMSCMTCHLPQLGTSDGRRLSIGQGGSGLGPDRKVADGVVIPRNAPAAFNLIALDKQFWDGRVSVDAHGVFNTPANAQLTRRMTKVFEFGAPAALGLFPVTSREEMRGARQSYADYAHDSRHRNELAEIGDDDFTGIWAALMTRLGHIPEYRRLFEDAYPGTPFRDMTFAHASNAIAGFLVDQLSFNNSPWDRFLAGNDRAMSPVEMRGAKNFLAARCSICHNGAALTDGQFHNVALVQFGPGKGNGAGGTDDFGRMNVTGDPREKYAFRTTPLRNVELTAPYGHAGQFTDLRDFVDHYSESELKLRNYDVRQLESSMRRMFVLNADAVMATRDTLLNGVVFAPVVIDEVTAYMRALTDPAARHLNHLTPNRVPSGLPVDRP